MDDRQARFEEVYDAYSRLILAYAARRTSNGEDAADVTAETFAVAWRRIDDVPAGEQARLWLYAVARRVLANHHRGNRRRRQLASRAAQHAARIVVDAATEGPDADAIAEAFARLTDADRELLTLVGWDGLDRDEVAEVMGCSRATVRVRLHRARRRFERHLSNVGVQRPGSAGHEHGRWATAHPDPEEA